MLCSVGRHRFSSAVIVAPAPPSPSGRYHSRLSPCFTRVDTSYLARSALHSHHSHSSMLPLIMTGCWHTSSATASPVVWALAVACGLVPGRSAWQNLSELRTQTVIPPSETSCSTASSSGTRHLLFIRSRSPRLGTLSRMPRRSQLGARSKQSLCKSCCTLIRLTMRWSEPPPAPTVSVVATRSLRSVLGVAGGRSSCSR